MFKKIGLSAVAMLGLLAMAPHQANAQVRSGVEMGRPAYPVWRPVVVAHPVIRRDYRWERRDVRWDRHDVRSDRHDYRFRR